MGLFSAYILHIRLCYIIFIIWVGEVSSDFFLPEKIVFYDYMRGYAGIQ
jgi:hypothetical protein